MEFKLMNPAKETDLSKMLIEFNNNELKKDIAQAVKKYEGITYTDDNIAEAKADRATLNKFKDALENKRKEIKKAYLVPYEKFEQQIKELVALVDKPILAIDTQVKEYENGLREQKKADIGAFYKTNIHSLNELLPLEKLWNDRWLNVTYKMSDIEKEITETIAKVQDDLAVIINLGSEFEFQIRDVYLKTLDLSTALKEKTRLEEQKARLEAYEKAKEAQNNVASGPRVVIDVPEEEIKTVPPEEEKLEVIDFRVYVTKTQKAALRQFFIDNKIKVGKIQ